MMQPHPRAGQGGPPALRGTVQAAAEAKTHPHSCPADLTHWTQNRAPGSGVLCAERSWLTQIFVTTTGRDFPDAPT